MNKLFLSLLAVFAISGVSFAQDTETPVTRSLGIYLDAFSGELTKAPDGTERLFADNEFEFGAVYSQNFATVPWLSMWLKALVVVGNKYWYENPTFGPIHGEPIVGTGSGPNLGIGSAGQILASPRAQIGLNLGGYSVFAIDTRGIFAQENYYTVNLGDGGAFTFLTILEFWAVPLARANYEVLGLYKHTVLDLFALRVDYGITFAEKWRFTTKLAFRFSDDATAARFKESFQIRWENQMLVNITDKFYMWTQLRYRIDNMAHSTLETDHRLYIQAGLGYTFDLSAL